MVIFFYDVFENFQLKQHKFSTVRVFITNVAYAQVNVVLLTDLTVFILFSTKNWNLQQHFVHPM